MKYVINKARSEKYKLSAVPQMQRILNKDYQIQVRNRNFKQCIKRSKGTWISEVSSSFEFKVSVIKENLVPGSSSAPPHNIYDCHLWKMHRLTIVNCATHL